MSHHLDTPLAAKTGQLFLDDLYVFPGPQAAGPPVEHRLGAAGIGLGQRDGRGPSRREARQDH
jgi:hypothetical protein